MGSSAWLAPARAAAEELGDYLWQARPLLVFAPADGVGLGRLQPRWGRGPLIGGTHEPAAVTCMVARPEER
jgi:hypothetical protein